MAPRTLTLAVVGTGCVLAAAVGGFLGLRLSSSETAAAPISAAVTSTAVAVETPPAADRFATPATPAPVEAPAAVPSKPAQTAQKPPVVSRSNTKPGGSVPAAAPPADVPAPVGSAPVAAPPASSAGAPNPETAVAVPAPAEPPAPVEPAKPRFDEVTVKEDSVIGVRLDTAISSETAKVEDRVSAHVTRDVEVDGRVAIPAGAKLEGTVTLVTRGGRFRERARLEVRFHTVVLNDNTRLPISTDRIARDGEAPAPEATSKIGASAVVGAILGAVVGGKKGAAIGGTAGAAGGTAAVMAGGANAATMAAGSQYAVRLQSPVTVLVERSQSLQ